jgi:PLAT/LH2 domain
MGFRLNTVIVIHTTSKASNAQTDASFTLNLRHPAGNVISLDFPDLPHNERERGRTDEYRFDVSGLGFNDMEFLKGSKTISMTIKSGDAWLPSSIYVIGVPNSGAPELLKTHVSWQHLENVNAAGWFSTEKSDGDGKAQATWDLDFEVPF